jgi:hypothetical protein
MADDPVTTAAASLAAATPASAASATIMLRLLPSATPRI